MQRAKHKIDNVFIAGFIIELCTDMSAYIRYFNTFYAIMHQLGGHVEVVYLKNTRLHALAQHVLEELHLFFVEPLACLLHLSDVAEEVGTERTVAVNHFLHHVQAGVDHLEHLLVGRNVLVGHALHGVQQDVQLRLDHGQVDILLALEVGIERASSFLRSEGDVVHRGVLDAHLRKKLTGDVH